jgi:hypothetical protein
MQWGMEETGIADSIVNMGIWIQVATSILILPHSVLILRPFDQNALLDRGIQNAEITYGANGYVSSCQSNLFGYVGMGGIYDGQSYPEVNACL